MPLYILLIILDLWICMSSHRKLGLELEPVQDPHPQQDQQQRQQDQQQPQEPRAARRRIRGHQDAPPDRAIIGIGSAAIIPPLVTVAPAPAPLSASARGVRTPARTAPPRSPWSV